MKRYALLIALICIGSISAFAQAGDVLGAHNVGGRGCVACHAPHSGAGGNGVTSKDPSTGGLALWGEDLSPLYGQTLYFGDAGGYTVTLPATLQGFSGAHDPNFVIIACLSCHDGNLATSSMMTGQTVETLPVAGGHAPTLLGINKTIGYNNQHPVGPTATIGCGGTYNWDCTISATGSIQMTGPASTIFAKTDYGFTVSPVAVGNVPTVTCTTCHDQHSMTIWSGTIGTVKANWNTSFFIRGPYTPGAAASAGTSVNNTAAQFCRNCHGGESNEMHGLTVPTSGATHL
jgi:cytochrome c553